MKPHLPLLLRAAVLACIAASFSNAVAAEAGTTPPDYTQPWVEPAEETPTQTITATGDYNATATATSTLTKGTTVSNVQFFAHSGNATGDFYGELQDTAVNWVCAYGAGRGADACTLVGNAYAKVSDTATVTINAIYGVVNGTLQAGDAGGGNAYVELDNPNATYGSINGAYNSDVDGSVTFVVRRGTVNGAVTGGSVNSNHTIGGGTYLQLEGGTYNGKVLGGNAVASTINGGSHIYICKGGTFNGMVTAGNDKTGSVINGGASMAIYGGTFKNYVIGGGFAGTVNGGVELTIAGGDFSALVTGNKGIYAGGGSSSSVITGGTTTTLLGIDGSNEFASYTGILSGGSSTTSASLTGTKTLELQGYTAGQVNARLQSFDIITVTQASEVSISASNNSTLGGATALSVEGESTLELAAGVSAWALSNTDTSVKAGSTLSKSGAGQMTLKSLSVESGSVKLKQDAGSLKIGATTFTAKEGGAEADGSTVIISENSTVSAKGGIAGTETGQAKLSHATITIDALTAVEVTTQEVAFIQDARFENVDLRFASNVGMSLSNVTFDAQSSALYTEGNSAQKGTIAAANTTLELVAAQFSEATPALLAEADSGSSGLTSTKVVNLDLSQFDALAFTNTLTLDDQNGYIKSIFDADPNVEEVVVNYGDAALSGVTGVTYKGSGVQAGIEGDTLVFRAQENVPEPSTATLSLLALAAIVARRRRKAA